MGVGQSNTKEENQKVYIPSPDQSKRPTLNSMAAASKRSSGPVQVKSPQEKEQMKKDLGKLTNTKVNDKTLGGAQSKVLGLFDEKDEKNKSPQQIENERKLAMAIIGIAPVLIGAAAGPVQVKSPQEKEQIKKDLGKLTNTKVNDKTLGGAQSKVLGLFDEKDEKNKSPQQIENERKLAMAIIGIAPVLIGAAAGGYKGGAIGGQVGSTSVAGMGEEFQKEREREAEKKETKEEREAREAFELKKLKVASDLDRAGKLELEMLKGRIGSGPKQKIDKLGAEERKRLDQTIDAIRAVDGMEAALRAGQSTISMVGDNDFTLHEKLYNEALSRMQSGGAITEEETKRFQKMAPTTFDSDEIRRKKIEELKTLFNSRLEMFGLSKRDFPQLTTPTKLAGEGTIAKSFGTLTSGYPKVSKEEFNNMSTEQREEFLKSLGR
jgi:hypothetical protein